MQATETVAMRLAVTEADHLPDAKVTARLADILAVTTLTAMQQHLCSQQFCSARCK